MQEELDIEGVGGRAHDLRALAAAVRTAYFPGQELLEIQWGKKITRRRRQSIRLGSYDPETKTIRIHPLLDSPRVPSWFIESIIHHEYLHHLLGARHNRRFQRHERGFRYHREARVWLRRYLPMLLGRRPLPMHALDPRLRRRSAGSVEQIALFAETG
jgi:hypothetical protein